MRALRALVVVLVLAAGCARERETTLRVASGTIVVDTGLADALARRFLASGGDRLAIRAVGSGEAFTLARQGEVDLLLVHEPEGLRALEQEGRVARSSVFALTDFVVVGPPDDPAHVAGSASYAEAFRRIAAAGAPFVSRGDRSGTNIQELRHWDAAGVAHDGGWYATTGLGQAETLRAADERGAYALTDAATLCVAGRALHLRVLAADDPDRATVYKAVALRGPSAAASQRFVDFAASATGRRTVRSFGAGRCGTPMFRPPEA